MQATKLSSGDGPFVWASIAANDRRRLTAFTKRVREGIFIAQSIDGGQSFSPAVQVPGMTDYRPMVALGPAGGYVVWATADDEATSNVMMTIIMHNTIVQPASQITDYRLVRINSPSIAVTADGVIYVAYTERIGAGAGRLLLIVSNDDGASFHPAPGWQAQGNNRTYSHISSMAVVAGKLIVAWVEEGGPVKTAMQDGAGGWAVITHASGRNYWPLIASDGSRAALVWQDSSTGKAEAWLRVYEDGIWRVAFNVSNTPDVHSFWPAAGFTADGQPVVVWQEGMALCKWQAGRVERISGTGRRYERPYIAANILVYQAEEGGGLNQIYAMPLYDAPQPQPEPQPNDNMTRGGFARLACTRWGIAPVTAPTPRFRDVPQSDPNYGYIEAAAARGIILGNADGDFMPTRFIKRGEMAIIIKRAKGYAVPDPVPQSFADVPPGNFYHPYVEAVRAAGIMLGGGDGLFRPSDTITTFETSILLDRTMRGGG